MKIIEPSFVFINPLTSGTLTRLDGIRFLKHVERMGRISHMSENRMTDESWKQFIPSVILKHGDWSIAEHASFTAQIRTDRGITHELVRHRLFAYTQESTRFVRHTGEMEFIAPLGVDVYAFDDIISLHFRKVYQDAEDRYHDMLDRRVSPQVARGILPTTLAATIAVTGNLRNWRHFFLMRTSKETHPDFKRISIPMLAEIKQLIPFLYDDITPDERQVTNLGKPR